MQFFSQKDTPPKPLKGLESLECDGTFEYPSFSVIFCRPEMVLKAICPTSWLVPSDAELLSGWEELQKNGTTNIGLAQLGLSIVLLLFILEK